ncbi:MAG: hypothetical protein ACRDND_22765, partial [Streptosporangiaceae bacterium]
RTLPADLASALLGPAREAFASGLHLVAGISAAVLAVVAVLMVGLLRGVPRPASRQPGKRPPGKRPPRGSRRPCGVGTRLILRPDSRAMSRSAARRRPLSERRHGAPTVEEETT